MHAPIHAENDLSPAIKATQRWIQWVSTLLGSSGIFLGLAVVAVAAETGTIEGRIANASSGNFLNNAVVSVSGGNAEALTNERGEYRLVNVPAGPVRVMVAFSGMEPQEASAVLAPGQVLKQDFFLVLAGRTLKSEVIELERYTVEERELTGQAVAEQERRNAPNIKSVISIDQFGDMGEGNVGEYLKYVPGISLTYDPQRPQSASIRGMPASGTIVMLDGAEMATSQSGTRTYDLGVSASGNVERVEVSKVPTPDMPANAVGGTINVITKNGFGRTKPLLSYNVFLTASGVGGLDDIDYSVRRKSGPDPDTRVAPNSPAYNVSYLMPVNKKLAFTFALSESSRPSDMQSFYSIWDQVGGKQTYNRPFHLVIFNEKRDLASITGTWRPADRHTLQASFQSTHSIIYTRQFQLNAQMGAGSTGDATFAQGAPTAVGSVQQAVPWATQYRDLKHGAVTYRYDGSLWKVDGGVVRSEAGTQRKDVDDGFFSAVATNLTGLIVRYDGLHAVSDQRGAIVTATDRAGAPVDIRNGENYSITAVNSNGPLNNSSTSTRATLNIRRDFETTFPFSIKVGGFVSEDTRDSSGGAYGYSFAPPGGAAAQRAGNYDVIDDDYSASHAITQADGTRATVRWINPYKVYQLFREHPEYFVFGPAQQAAQYTSRVTLAKSLKETIPGAYVRGDLKLLDNRLWLSGGVRFEQTRDFGRGPLNDVGATFQKNPDGSFVRNTSGRLVPITTDVLATARLRYTEFGTTARRTYDGYFPSLNSSYVLSKHLMMRAAYARTIGRPDLSFIIPGVTISDPNATTPLNTLNIVNTGLKPWTANNFDLTLELYSFKGATASVSAFRKDIKNFFGATRFPATPEILEENGLSDDYLAYEVITRENFGAATIQGVELAYRQSLAAWLPAFARGVEVYGNATTMSLSGPNAEDFTTFSPHEASAGLSYVHPRFVVKVNVQRSGWIRNAAVAASATVPAGAYNYVAPQTRVDVSAEYRFNRKISLYGSIRNLNHKPKRQAIRGPGIPDYTVMNYYQYTGTLLTLGLKGEF